MAPETRERPARSKQVEVGENKQVVFQAGRLKQFISEWEKVTKDPKILEIVKGAKIEFDEESDLEFPGVSGRQLYHVAVATELDELIQEFLELKVIKTV